MGEFPRFKTITPELGRPFIRRDIRLDVPAHVEIDMRRNGGCFNYFPSRIFAKTCRENDLEQNYDRYFFHLIRKNSDWIVPSPIPIRRIPSLQTVGEAGFVTSNNKLNGRAAMEFDVFVGIVSDFARIALHDLEPEEQGGLPPFGIGVRSPRCPRMEIWPFAHGLIVSRKTLPHL